MNCLSQSSIQNAIKQLRDYQNSLTYKCQIIAQKLAEKGIEVGKNNVGNFGHYILFSKKTDLIKNGCQEIILAEDLKKNNQSMENKRWWNTKSRSFSAAHG